MNPSKFRWVWVKSTSNACSLIDCGWYFDVFTGSSWYVESNLKGHHSSSNGPCYLHIRQANLINLEWPSFLMASWFLDHKYAPQAEFCAEKNNLDSDLHKSCDQSITSKKDNSWALSELNYLSQNCFIIAISFSVLVYTSYSVSYLHHAKVWQSIFGFILLITPFQANNAGQTSPADLFNIVLPPALNSVGGW